MYTLLGDLTIARWSVACCLCTLSWSKETVPMVIDVWVEIKPQLGGAFECIPLFVKKASCSDTVGSWKMEPVFTWWDTADSTNYLRESKKSFFHLLVNDVSGSRGVFPNVTEICFCVSSASAPFHRQLHFVTQNVKKSAWISRSHMHHFWIVPVLLSVLPTTTEDFCKTKHFSFFMLCY